MPGTTATLMHLHKNHLLFCIGTLVCVIAGCANDEQPSNGERVAAGGTTAQSSGLGGALGGSLSNSSVARGGSGIGGSSNYVEPVENLDRNAEPAPVATVNLEVAESDIDQLDANPFHALDVPGSFVDGSGVRYSPIEVNYRGAYALQNLIRSRSIQRNWKLKFSRDVPYQDRREWNFNYEQHVRQRMTYSLMRLANVKVPGARHVVLRVNGATHGLYLEYEDPDNKSWLLDKFGDNEGDLYKAGYDLPGEPPHFATLEVLGDTDAAYYDTYSKKTNNDDPTKAADYSSLRKFIAGLNQTPDAEFEAFLRANFDVDRFINYLVVANFVSHWDSLPQRPKNYWLYQIPATSKWVFIPWDMDATFQSEKFSLNPMGTDASVFYQFDRFSDYPGRQSAEGTARPLVRRTMKVPAFRNAYVARYREALGTFLEKNYLLGQVAKLTEMAAAVAQPDELESLNEARSDMEKFITARHALVTAELGRQP